MTTIHERVFQPAMDGPSAADLLQQYGRNVAPEALINMARTRLQSIDHQLHSTLDVLGDREVAAQRNANQQAVLREIHAFAAGTEDNLTLDQINARQITINGVTKTAAAWIAELELGSHFAIDEGSFSDMYIAAKLDQVKEQGRRITSNNDLLMLEIQQLTHERSQVITLVTQMLNSMKDADQAVVRNV